MSSIRHTFLATFVMVTLLCTVLARADEAAVRNATQGLVDAWNRHDPKAWSDLFPEDIWYTETDERLYQRYKGRAAAVARFGYSVENSDLSWEVLRIKSRPDGIVNVVLSQHMSMLPKTDGKYKAVFTSNPSIARWRREADGQWRIFFFTSHKGWALAEIKKDEEGVAAPAAELPQTARVAPARVAAGGEPKEYSAFWGRLAHNCNYCHGRPPALPSSQIASRIVAVGAATADGAELRAAMQRKELAGVMDWLLADPALDDRALEVVRSYLVEVRDGRVPDELGRVNTI